MSQGMTPTVMVGNEFVLPRPRLTVAPAAAAPLMPTVAIVPVMTPHQEAIPVNIESATAASASWLRRGLDVMHRYTVASFALLFLLVGVVGVRVAGSYYSAAILSSIKPASLLKSTSRPIAGLNLSVPVAQLQNTLQTITNQSATLNLGSQTVSIPADTIKSWLQITASQDKQNDYIHISAATIGTSLTNLANQYVKAPVNQVSVNTGGSTPLIITAGQNGTALADSNGLKQQAQAVAKNVLGGKGLQFNAPLVSVPFQSSNPCDGPGKCLLVSTTQHLMQAKENGQVVQSFEITAGASQTPTPLGVFHIWEKLASQTMTGKNLNGTTYVQPNVPWVNYFDHSGDAVHGNYWRPYPPAKDNVFGVTNTSHGCVGVRDDDGEDKWVYDWAPIGTTVVTTDAPITQS